MKTRHAVAVEILTKGGLQRLQSITGARHGADQVRHICARAVEAPDREIVVCRILPGDIITPAGRDSANGRPGAKFTDGYGGAAKGQLCRRAADFDIVVADVLDQTSGTVRLDQARSRAACRVPSQCLHQFVIGCGKRVDGAGGREGEKGVRAGAGRPIAEIARRIRVPVAEIRCAAIDGKIGRTRSRWPRCQIPHAIGGISEEVHQAVGRHIVGGFAQIGIPPENLGNLVFGDADEIILACRRRRGRGITVGRRRTEADIAIEGAVGRREKAERLLFRRRHVKGVASVRR